MTRYPTRPLDIGTRLAVLAVQRHRSARAAHEGHVVHQACARGKTH